MTLEAEKLAKMATVIVKTALTFLKTIFAR